MTVTGTPAASSSSFTGLVKGIVLDDSGKLLVVDDNSLTAYDRAIAAALNTYSKHRPAIAVADIAGDGTSDYDLPAAWVDGSSEVKSIEFPIGNVPADLIDSDEYTLYQSPTEQQLRLLNDTPAVGESFRLAYTIPRTEETILTGDLDAVAHLAAANALDILANAWLQLSDSTISADVVNYRSKSQEATSRAKAVRKLYFSHLGITEEQQTPAASAVADYDMRYPGGGGRLTHNSRDRRRR